MLLHPSNNPIIEAGRQRRAWPIYSCHGLRAASVAVVCLFWCSILPAMPICNLEWLPGAFTKLLLCRATMPVPAPLVSLRH